MPAIDRLATSVVNESFGSSSSWLEGGFFSSENKIVVCAATNTSAKRSSLQGGGRHQRDADVERRHRRRRRRYRPPSMYRAEGVKRENVGVFVQARGWPMSFLAASIRAVTELSSPYPLVATPA